jgi:ATP-dependent RNA helicase DDX56/DBP9
VQEEAAAIAQHCGAELAVTALIDKGSAAAQRTAIATAGQLVVATPGRIAQVGVRHDSHAAHVSW